MRRAAWVNQAIAIWLIGFVIFGLSDSASGVEIASHGSAALVLLLTSWRVLTSSVRGATPAVLQIAAGVLLAVLPLAFRYPLDSLLALHDLVAGLLAAVVGAVQLTGRSESRDSPNADGHSE